MHLNFFEFA